MKETYLTKEQARVLKLKSEGMTQVQIAKLLKTSRANISILEKRARTNIERAERTVRLAAKLKAQVVLNVEAGTDLFSVPKLLFREADKAKIQVKLTATDIIARIQRDATDKIHGRSVTKNFEVAVTSEGEIIL